MEKEIIKAQALVRAAELQAYGEIDKNKLVRELPQKSISEIFEDWIKTKKEIEEAIKKLKEEGLLKTKKV